MGMDTDERRLAKITDTWLGFEDHGCFGFNIQLDYGGTSQGFGFYSLGHTDRKSQQWIPNPRGLESIRGILEACGVDRWEKLKGRTVFAIIENGDQVRGLAPLPTECGEEFDVRKLWPRE